MADIRIPSIATEDIKCGSHADVVIDGATGYATIQNHRSGDDYLPHRSFVVVTRETVEKAVAWAREAGGPAYDENDEWCEPIARLAQVLEETR